MRVPVTDVTDDDTCIEVPVPMEHTDFETAVERTLGNEPEPSAEERVPTARVA